MMAREPKFDGLFFEGLDGTAMAAKIVRTSRGVILAMSEPTPGLVSIYTVNANGSKIPLYQGPDRSKADSAYQEAVKAAPKH